MPPRKLTTTSVRVVEATVTPAGIPRHHMELAEPAVTPVPLSFIEEPAAKPRPEKRLLTEEEVQESRALLDIDPEAERYGHSSHRARVITADMSHALDRLEAAEAEIVALKADRDRERNARRALEREVRVYRHRLAMLASHFDGLSAWASMPVRGPTSTLHEPPVVADQDD